jgi:hypothetical protein
VVRLQPAHHVGVSVLPNPAPMITACSAFLARQCAPAATQSGTVPVPAATPEGVAPMDDIWSAWSTENVVHWARHRISNGGMKHEDLVRMQADDVSGNYLAHLRSLRDDPKAFSDAITVLHFSVGGQVKFTSALKELSGFS